MSVKEKKSVLNQKSAHYTATPFGFNIEVVYVDDALIVVNKPPSLLSVPGLSSKHNLRDAVAYTFGDVSVVHRLDCETSGLMVFARNPLTLKHLHRQFAHRQIDKTYEALGYGESSLTKGVIDLPLAGDYPNRPKQRLCFQKGRQAITFWEVLHSADRYTRFRLTPITGRTHQLRVHLAHLGHPILGDKLYTQIIRPVEAVLYPNMCLHATELGFFHPEKEQRMIFHSPPPF